MKYNLQIIFIKLKFVLLPDVTQIFSNMEGLFDSCITKFGLLCENYTTS